jgi:hypothetical protein
MSATEPTTAVGTTVLFENQRVWVWELRLAPGETCPPHRHRAGPHRAAPRVGHRSPPAPPATA